MYEEFGRNVTIKLPIRRRVGFFGSLIVTWQANSEEANGLDYSPSSGTVDFADQQTTANIVISIIDDPIPENMEVSNKRNCQCYKRHVSLVLVSAHNVVTAHK